MPETEGGSTYEVHHFGSVGNCRYGGHDGAMAMPALAFHNTLPPISEECGKGKCPGLGVDKNYGASVNNKMGDDRNDACNKNGLCLGTHNN